MALICLPQEAVNKLKRAFTEGGITIAKLTEMTDAQRRAWFEKSLSKEEAQFANGSFEKAMVSSQKNALTNWVKSQFVPELKRIGQEAQKIAKEKGLDPKDITKDASTLSPTTEEGKLALARAKTTSKAFESVINKVQGLDKLGVLNPKIAEDYLSDLVATKLGVSVSPEEAKIISEKSKVLEQKWQDIKDKGFEGDIMSDESFAANLEFQQLKMDMEKTLQGFNPSSRAKVFFDIIAPGNLLFSIKSVMNILGYHLGPLIGEPITRAVEAKRVLGMNPDLIKDYMARNISFNWATQMDTSRMMSLKDSEKILGMKQVGTEGPGATRAVGRFFRDYIWGKLHNTPYAVIASFHFAQTADIFSTRFALNEGLKGAEAKVRAKEIALDAMKIEPKTEAGTQVRELARSAAEYGTYTNKTALADISNTARGMVPGGKALIPFATIEANAISNGLDYAGVSMLRDGYKLITQAKRGEIDIKTKQEFFRNAVRAGIGLTMAMTVASQLQPQDYDMTRDSVKFGGLWFSLKYFGPLAAPLRGYMMTKQKKGITTYPLAQAEELFAAPGVKGAMDIATGLKTALSKSDKPFVEQNAPFMKQTVDFAQSRLEPMIVSDIANALDPYQRQVSSTDIFSGVKKSTPLLSQTLPVKKDLTGKPMLGEPPLLDILSGSNIKTQTPVPTLEQKNLLKEQAREAIRQGDNSKVDELIKQGIIKKRGKARFIKDAKKKK